jgi:tetratricopeptide (TPR) repeat protein
MAVRLDPKNSEYAHRLGRYYDLVGNDPTAALAEYQNATRLNPHDSRYWLDLANTYQLLGDMPNQAYAIDQAIRYDSKTPDVAWEAANLYLVQGNADKALRAFRTVMEGAPYMNPLALQLCWRIQPDVDVLLRDVIPHRQDSYEAFLLHLMSKGETEGTVRVWKSLYDLHQTVDLQRLFEYIRYLLQHKAVGEASRVWRQATALLNLSAYLPSSNNLIVNGGFALPVLNGGFDWQYQQQSSVSLTLDPTNFHSGPRSLSIVFDGPGIEEAGIYQLIAVQPKTAYEFSGYYKNEDIEGAGGPHLALQDFYTAQTLYESEELRDGFFWKNVSGEFTTGPDTRLLILRVQRLPAGGAIRGRLWIDDLRLAEESEEGTQ